MAAGSIASQLRAIKSFIQVEGEPPSKRPFTRPSIIFDPKEAADIDLLTILSIAHSGLEVLVQNDNRFGGYKNSLFSDKSRDVDRELMGVEENNKINDSITSYLRLLSGYLHLPSSLKTLEYLFRRYKIHIYNIDELILSALPNHETHAFVQIIQLLELGNSKWKFLEGVKVSGAPPPRRVIVQQCIRDTSILETLCKYATPIKKYQPSAPVIGFFTSVVVEILGALPLIDDGTVRRILPFVFSGLEPTSRGGTNHKAGALMLIVLLAHRVALAPKAVKAMIDSIARVARHDTKESFDLQWLRMLLMAIISLVQSQSIQMLPKKGLEILAEVRDFAEVVLGLAKEFNIKRFLSVYLESLANYSSSDDFCRSALISAIRTLPVDDFIFNVVNKVLASCVALSRRVESSELFESGCWAKQIFCIIDEIYPGQLRGAFCKFLEESKVNDIGDSVFETLSLMIEGGLDFSADISKSKFWLSLEHPNAVVRRDSLSRLATSDVLEATFTDFQRNAAFQDVMLRRLCDDDLGIVKLVLSLRGLSKVMDTTILFGALHDLLLRCIDSVMTGKPAASTSEVCDVAVSCLDFMISNFSDHIDFSKRLATVVFPLLLVLPKSWKLNIKALQLAEEIRWPFYRNILGSHDFLTAAKGKAITRKESLSASINMGTIETMAETFAKCPEEYMLWLIECSNDFELSKTLFFLVMLQSLIFKREELGAFAPLFRASFPVLKQAWRDFELSGDCLLMKELTVEKLDGDCTRFISLLSNPNLKVMNGELLITIFWRLMKATVSLNDLCENQEWVCAVDELFILFAASPIKIYVKEHLHLLVTKCRITPVALLSKFYTEEGFSVAVQIESLLCYTRLCSQFTFSEKSIRSSDLQLLLDFPSVLVPISSKHQDVRVAAMKCIEGIYNLWQHINTFGSDTVAAYSIWTPCLGEFLGLLREHQTLIISDQDFLPSFLTILLGTSCNSLLAPQNLDKRFAQHTKEALSLFILSSALKLSAYGKFKVLALFKEMGGNLMRVEGVKSFLFELLERRINHHVGLVQSCQPLSNVESDTLCLLLVLFIKRPAKYSAWPSLSGLVHRIVQVNGLLSEDLVVVQPCVTVLENLNSFVVSRMKTDSQDNLLQMLVILFRNDNGAIQDAAKEAVLRIDLHFKVSSSTIRTLLAQEDPLVGMSDEVKTKKHKKKPKHNLHYDLFCGGRRISFLSSLLDLLLLKKNIENRGLLVESLVNLLREAFSEKWLLPGPVGQNEILIKSLAGVSENVNDVISYFQQRLFLILEDIIADGSTIKDKVLTQHEMSQLVDCVRSAKNATTRNHAFSLLATITKFMPTKVMDHIIDIFIILGEASVLQDNSHSKIVFEELISAIAPCWLSKTNSLNELLQVFINVLPDIAKHRRLTIIVHLLRSLGEQRSLSSFFFLLIRSLVQRKRKSFSDANLSHLEILTSTFESEWEYIFAIQVYEQYSCMIWLPSLVMLLEKVEIGDRFSDQAVELLISLQFVLHKLKNTELVFKLESNEGSDDTQRTLGALMDKVVLLLCLVRGRCKKLRIPTILRRALKECIHMVLKIVTKEMFPSTYFKCITLLLGHGDNSVREEALGLLCETVKDYHIVNPRSKDNCNLKQTSVRSWLHLNETSVVTFGEMCLKILQLIDGFVGDTDASLKLTAVSALEVLANQFSSYNPDVFMSCLTSLVKHIGSEDIAISSRCLRTTGALVNVLGPKALSELPFIMKHMSRSANVTSLMSKESLQFSILVTMEAVVSKLGSFLSPYVDVILELLVLHPDYVSGLDPKMKMKADTLRKLVIEKIPVRHMLSPLLKLNSKAIQCGESSLSIIFAMLASTVGIMDKSSIGSYHEKIFEQCLLALDLRREHTAAVKNIDIVENAVIRTIVVLTMKLTETMFKPLFVRCLEWAESESAFVLFVSFHFKDAKTVFRGSVDKVVESHIITFRKYLRYTMFGNTRHRDDGVVKLGEVEVPRWMEEMASATGVICDRHVPTKWMCGLLVLSKICWCFLHIHASKHLSHLVEVLLKPIVSQLAVEALPAIDESEDVPSVKEVDDSLVSCLGQMAVTAGSDLLWKPLNHEVLMQTRSEKVRARILGLRVIKYLVEHLKEEYLVLLEETIRTLGELLEDVELPVKTLAQEIFKEIEEVSGENIKCYL
ncbi:hypothetical protein Syun_012273 [Stephania yunnanensis]|uniref:BP28 C-terminal domain-containing protein n=1 Tax=Stephania yunnanensis TaxID=152371 RepID=A0AAP0JZ40_9MAGN